PDAAWAAPDAAWAAPDAAWAAPDAAWAAPDAAWAAPDAAWAAADAAWAAAAASALAALLPRWLRRRWKAIPRPAPAARRAGCPVHARPRPGRRCSATAWSRFWPRAPEADPRAASPGRARWPPGPGGAKARARATLRRSFRA
ncbi:MAG: hypothetical protein FJ125_14985, partial [Deltaproteobacteria bacterium]|nr:hypothetical protein [Deltaproteobacteria bacterium]